VFYGFYHRRTLQAEADAHKLEHAAHSREHLIAEAKAAYQKSKASQSKDDGGTLAVICQF
jgi:F-type H+-transporting ATP synthase subunit e